MNMHITQGRTVYPSLIFTTDTTVVVAVVSLQAVGVTGDISARFLPLKNWSGSRKRDIVWCRHKPRDR